MSSVLFVLGLVCLYFETSSAQAALGKYNVDRNMISVSGVSSGAAMATQLHVAYSAVFMGAGILAGNPFYCAQGHVTQATGACIFFPERIPINELVSQTTTWSSSGAIDRTDNMYNDKIYVFNGALDSAVDPGIGQKIMQYYYSFVRSENIKGVFDVQAEHTVPTIDYGNACNQARTPYISKCNFDFAFEMLNYVYGNLQRPDTPSGALPGQFIQFDQREFIPNFASMGTSGYIYVPTRCVSGTTACKLHVALHGCRQGNDFVGDEFARHGGYNYVGELNDIIILYPNAVQSIAAPVNPQGCWDWWGYTDNNYAIKRGPQMDAVYKMVQRVAL